MRYISDSSGNHQVCFCCSFFFLKQLCNFTVTEEILMCVHFPVSTPVLTLAWHLTLSVFGFPPLPKTDAVEHISMHCTLFPHMVWGNGQFLGGFLTGCSFLLLWRCKNHQYLTLNTHGRKAMTTTWNALPYLSQSIFVRNSNSNQ